MLVRLWGYSPTIDPKFGSGWRWSVADGGPDQGSRVGGAGQAGFGDLDELRVAERPGHAFDDFDVVTAIPQAVRPVLRRFILDVHDRRVGVDPRVEPGRPRLAERPPRRRDRRAGRLAVVQEP